MSAVYREENRIVVQGDLYDFHRLLSHIHQAIENAEYQDIILDMKECTSAFPGPMLSLCAQVMAYRKSGIDFSLEAPKDKKLFNLFQNTNWNHLLDPKKYDPSRFRGHSRIPATQYQTPVEQNEAVNKIVNVILGAIPDMQRRDFAAFEWSINEITDNVLVHSDSAIGGLVQVSTFKKNSKQVQFVVADAGVGIPKSLRGGRPDLTSDTDALDHAIKEGVTRDTKIGQGNGLFGSYQICSLCEGHFRINAGNAKLEFHNKKGLSISYERIPYGGTLVEATIDFTQPGLLEKALNFRGKEHHPVDFVEVEYEKSDDGDIHFIVENEAQSFGSRVAGKPVRTKLSNLERMVQGSKIIVDMKNIPIMSSSFADEAFGKLFMQTGALTFMGKFQFINVMPTVKQLIDKAIAQRMAVGEVD
ncbi:TPA: DUF4325 domain-containing protein [Vibrio vulnificus]